ncbi:hypothetical protein ALQ86_05453, partial [Pseudomonas amygdali pv. eriobotryae]
MVLPPTDCLFFDFRNSYHMDYELHEGSITLPEGFQDRTVNMFVLGSTLPAPLSITVSRDTLLSTELLKTYVDRQVKMLS